MPELPEVENVVRSLHYITARKLSVVSVLQAETVSLKYNSYDDFVNSVLGFDILSIKRRGKYILFELSHPERQNKNYLIVHLAMTGALLHLKSQEDFDRLESKIRNHIYVILQLSDSSYLIYSDYRRFGSVRVVTESQLLDRGSLSHLKTLQELGPEPFDEDAFPQFLERIRKKKYEEKPIKNVLLDQTIIAGVGNIYASECLFEPQVYPTTLVKDLSDDKLKDIFDCLVDILKRSIEAGGTSIKDYVNSKGEAGTFESQLKLYNKIHCIKCSSPLDKFYLRSRITYACPQCQK